MEQVHRAKALEQAGEWVEVRVQAAVGAVVLQQALAGTVFVQIAGKNQFINWGRLAMSSNVPSAALP